MGGLSRGPLFRPAAFFAMPAYLGRFVSLRDSRKISGSRPHEQ